MNTVKVCENGVQAEQAVQQLTAEGYDKDNIYLFAHGKERAKDLNDALDTENVGMSEQGVVDSVKNIFNKRGDELRSEFQSVGLSKEEAAQYERVLDGGELVLVAKK